MLIQYPYNIIPIIDQLRKRDWLIANFETPDSDIYNPVDYVFNRRSYGVDYHLHLDRNIYSYICSFNTQKITAEIRDSIALLNFAWMAEIIVAPTLAVYEGINYSKEKVEKALDELELFRRIDNSDPEQTARFATGEQDTFPLFNIRLENREELRKELVKYERLEAISNTNY